VQQNVQQMASQQALQQSLGAVPGAYQPFAPFGGYGGAPAHYGGTAEGVPVDEEGQPPPDSWGAPPAAYAAATPSVAADPGPWQYPPLPAAGSDGGGPVEGAAAAAAAAAADEPPPPMQGYASWLMQQQQAAQQAQRHQGEVTLGATASFAANLASREGAQWDGAGERAASPAWGAAVWARPSDAPPPVADGAAAQALPFPARLLPPGGGADAVGLEYPLFDL
jgi:hypothetical protein